MTLESQLPYIVECNMGFVYEPIAAFNCLSVAEDYAQRCADVPRGITIQYRLRYGMTVRPIKPKRMSPCEN